MDLGRELSLPHTNSCHFGFLNITGSREGDMQVKEYAEDEDAFFRYTELSMLYLSLEKIQS